MSQYELKKLDPEVKIKLEWHGVDTLVQVERNAEKVVVKTGDVIEVSLELGKQLLQYSGQWTLEGDKPTVHGWDKARAAAFARLEAEAKAPKGKKVAKAAEAEAPALTAEDIKKMKTKDVTAKLTELGVAFEANAKLADLKDALLKAVEAKAAEAAPAASTEDDKEDDEESDEE